MFDIGAIRGYDDALPVPTPILLVLVEEPSEGYHNKETIGFRV